MTGSAMHQRSFWIPVAGILLLYISGFIFATASESDILLTIFKLTPFVLGGLYIFIFHLTLFWKSMILLFPVSINVIFSGVGVGAPAEPMMLMLFLVLLFNFTQKPLLFRGILKHPLSIAIFLYLAWALLTGFSSTYLLVSLKYLLIRTISILVLYFGFAHFFIKKGRVKEYFLLYGIGLTIVVLYSLKQHSQWGFMMQTTHGVSRPFYNDHTIYGAALAMILPPIFILVFKSKTLQLNKWERLLYPALLILFSIALYFSFSRAAWISLILVILFYPLLKIRIRPAHIMGLTGILVLIVFMAWPAVQAKLDENENVSAEGNVTEHLTSATNVSTDESNRERINRWSCAIRMFMDKPFLGFGPGTYQFNYIDYQRSKEMTRISLTDVSEGGDVHSEYLKVLSESGFAGLGTWLLIVFGATFTGMRVFYEAKDPWRKWMALGIMLGMLTYLIHSFFNNFLSTDKGATLFWPFLAMLVALDTDSKSTNLDAVSEAKDSSPP